MKMTVEPVNHVIEVEGGTKFECLANAKEKLRQAGFAPADSLAFWICRSVDGKELATPEIL